MDKVAYYKEEIEKMANETKEYARKRLMRQLLDDTQSERGDYYRTDMKNHLENSPTFDRYVEGEMFNDERAKIKHPHGRKAALGTLGLGAAIGSYLTSKKTNVAGATKLIDKAKMKGKAAIPGAIMGLLGASVPAALVRQLMNEKRRTSIAGPMKTDHWDDMDDEIHDTHNSFIRNNESYKDYSHVQTERMKAKAQAEAARAASAAASAYALTQASERMRNR